MEDGALKIALIQQAELSFVILSREVDAIFDLLSFYLDRFPSDGSPSAILKDRELKTCIDNLAQLITQLADILKKWKHSEPVGISKVSVELNVLNEIWANITALVYFLISHDIDLYPFNTLKAGAAFDSLIKCNKLLT